MKKIFFLVILLGWISSTMAQPCGEVLPGETVPDLQMSLAGKKGVTQLSAYKKRLIILDFWATWCGSCIASFDKLEKLQGEFSKDIKVLLVNSASSGDNAQKVSDFYKKWERTHPKKLSLETVVDDRQLDKMFSHKSIPHCVWVLDGVVKAITGSGEISAANITAVLNDPEFQPTPKIELDRERPLFIMDVLPLKKVKGFSILTQGLNAGLDWGFRWTKNDSGAVVRFTGTNITLLDTYKYIVSAIDENLGQYRRIILQVKDSTSIFRFDSSMSRGEWQLKNLVSFDFVGGPKGEAIYMDMLSALDAYTGYNAVIRKMKVRCLALTAHDKEKLSRAEQSDVPDSLKSPGRPLLLNQDISVLVKLLNERAQLSYPVIDETKFTGKINVGFNRTDFTNIKLLNEALLKYGLVLKEEDRELDMLVITDQLLK